MGFSPVEWGHQLEKLWPHGVRYVRKIYKWVPHKTERSLAVDRQRGARCFIVSSLLAIPPALCTRIWLSPPRYGLQITEDVAQQRGTMLNLAFIVDDHGTGHPHCDGNTHNIKKKRNYMRLEGTQHLLKKKKEIEKGNPSAFQCVVLWWRVCDESASDSPSKRRQLYRVKRPTEFQSKSSLDKFEFIISRSRKRGFISWESNYESGSVWDCTDKKETEMFNGDT